MKYNNRKKTPLKWNWLLRLFLLLEFVYLVYDFIILMMGLFSVGNGNSLVLSYLQQEGVSINDLGNYFWPVVIYIMYRFIVILIIFFAVFGLWKWKSYGPKCTIFIFISRFLLFLIVLISIIKYGSSNIELIESLNFELTNNESIAIIIGLFLILTIYYFLQTVLNTVYYHKRKLLFDEYYVQPIDKASGVVVEEGTVSTTATLQNDAKETNEFNSQQTEHSLEIDNNNGQLKTCPNCGKVIDSDNDNYCDNCGSKLKKE